VTIPMVRTALIGILFSCLLGAIAPSTHLSQLTIDRFEASHGIPEEAMRRIARTPDGYIWVSTENGLLRFDGQRSRTFILGPVENPDRAVWGLELGQDGALWVGARTGGVYRLIPDSRGSFAIPRIETVRGAMQSGSSNQDLGMSPDGLIYAWRWSDITCWDRAAQIRPCPWRPEVSRDITWSADGVGWAAGADVIHRWRNGQTAKIPLSPGTDIRAIAAGPEGLWIASASGLWRVDHGSETARRIVGGVDLYAVTVDPHGGLWLGGRSGVLRWRDGQLERQDFPGGELNGPAVDILETPDGAVWVTTHWGNLFRLREPRMRTYGSPEAMGGDVVTAVARIGQEIWAGFDHGGLGRVDMATGAGSRLGILDGQTVLSLTEDAAGQRLAGLRDGLYRITPHRAELVLKGQTLAHYFGETGKLYLSTAEGVYEYPSGRWGPREPCWRISPLNAHALLPLKHGGGGGLLLIRAREGETTVWREGKERALNLPRLTPPIEVRTGLEDRRGWLWVGTSHGLFLFRLGEFDPVGGRALLASDSIFELAEDDQGFLWIGTRAGLLRIPRGPVVRAALGEAEFPEAIRLGRDSGLRGINFGTALTNHVARSEGRIWLASLRGLVMVEPGRFNELRAPPRVSVEEFSAGGEEYLPFGRPIRLPAGANSFDARLVVLHPAAPSLVRGAYRLDPIESDWTHFTSRWQAAYRGLRPGAYQLRVRAASIDGVWDDRETVIPFSIPPRWYESNWVRVAAGAVLLVAVLAGFRRRERRIQREQRILEQRVAERTAELAAAKEKAELAVEAKGRFLAAMSHEIRTPLNGMIGASLFLEHAGLDPDNQEWVRVLRSSAESLLAVVNDVLDYSKIEAGRLQIEHLPFDLHELVRDAAGLFQTVARQKGLGIQVEIDPDAADGVEGDPTRIRQILLNLLGNAVKFTTAGEIRVRVRRQGGEHQIAVTDTGIGIAPEDLRRLFQEFSQLDTGTARRYGGTGLGLAISQALANLMGGRIEVESRPGAGSTFTLSVPLADRAEGSNSLASAPRTVTPLGSPAVLVVDDNPVNRKIAARLLEQMGCRVEAADGGAAAVQAAQSQAFDVIFMDCQMPEVDGFEATRQLRESGVHTPIVALTAHAMPDDRARCLISGMDDYLPKPVRPADLETMVRRWCVANTAPEPVAPAPVS
jgi:signal transduction histidine kinase/CheY-like chemotaxis protein/ligand-binding sensor domain-containing protein